MSKLMSVCNLIAILMLINSDVNNSTAYIYIVKSYVDHRSTICAILLETAISILTRPNTLTLPLEYNHLFKSQSQQQYKMSVWKKLPILGLILPYF